MTEEWNELIQQMPGLLEQLTSQPLIPSKDCRILPRKGIYVFYENGKAIYTGRTNNMKRRLSQHCNPSSGHNSATFAFNIAKREASKAGIDVSVTRSQLEKNSRFSELYLAATE